MALVLLPFIFLTIFLSFVAAQQTNCSISVGASLTATPDVKPWLSSSGDFAFGFQQLEGNDNFLLSIWYNKIPSKTIIWYPEGGPMVPKGSKVELTNGRGLVLRDPQGREVWSSSSSTSVSDLSCGFMNDTGNFVILGNNSSKIWESFKFPADTILPTQVVEINGDLNSKKRKINFSRGKFQLRLLPDGNLVLNTRDVFSNLPLDAYYISGTRDADNYMNSGYLLIFDETGYLYILRRNGERYDLTPPDTLPSGDYYHRATLDSDGLFTQYYHPKNPTGNSSWEIIWYEPKEICFSGSIGSGACGLNNVCSLDGNRPKCECPQGFSLLDSNDPNGDCYRDFSPRCDESYKGDLFDFIELNNTDWPGSDYAHIRPSSEQSCKLSCREDCFCAVAIFRDDQCWKKALPLSHGKKISSEYVKVFLKYQKDEHPSRIANHQTAKPLICAGAQQQTNGSVSVGASLTATPDVKPWLSSSGDFAFGFQQLEGNDDFLLSIWYDKIPDKTIIWYPRTNATVSRGSKVELIDGRGLVLSDPQGRQVWTTSSTSISSDIGCGFMNDTGNFVILDNNYSKIWESFSFPADTLLPTQVMEIGGEMNSKKNKTNFSRGRFQLRLLQDGNLVLNTRDVFTTLPLDAYYSTPTLLNSGYRLIFDSTGYMHILTRNGERYDLTERDSLPSGDYYHRATLDSDGLFTQYYHPKNPTGNASWEVIWFKPDDICSSSVVGSGACGHNNICSLDGNRPDCECPQGFSLVDPNDRNGDCKPDFTPRCDEGYRGDMFDFNELTNTDWPGSDYAHIGSTNEQSCKISCKEDCLCSVAIFRDNQCWKKALPLSNGKKTSTKYLKIFLKYQKDERPPPRIPPWFPGENKDNNRRSLILVGSVLLSSFLFVISVLIGVIFLGFFLNYKKKPTNPYPSSKAVETNLPRFTYQELVEATNGFTDELGRGAFGIVYKGVIGTNIVAVKKLDRVVQDGEKEFQTEVNAIAKTHHKNLVQLLGYCDDGDQRLLIYEYMTNGTLAAFLFGDMKPNWKQRSYIAVGIAKGLAYLHEECSTQIIHCDIKPQNILLDDYYNAKISDFGLAKLLSMDQSRTNTGIRGTKGYVAPEWFRNTPVTVKVDVFSFGVLLLEIVSCRKSVKECPSGDEYGGIILTDWAWDCYQEKRLNLLVENDWEAIDDVKKVTTFVEVGLWCVQENPSLRPTMRKVIQMLEEVIEVTEPPCPFPLYVDVTSC